MFVVGKQFLERSVKSQLLILYGILLTGLMITSAALLYQETLTLSEKQMTLVGKQLSRQTANASINMLVNGDRLSLNVLLEPLIDSPYIAGAAIYGVDKRRITSIGEESHEEEVVFYQEPIVYQDVIIGHFILYMNRLFLEGQAISTVYPFLIISFLFLVVGLLIVYFYGSYLVDRLYKLERQLTVLFPDLMIRFRKNELCRVLDLTEGQLTRYAMRVKQKMEQEFVYSRVAIGFSLKNIEELRAREFSNDMEFALASQKKIIDKISKLYHGKADYWTGGKGCIYFMKNEKKIFYRALSCALSIVVLFSKEVDVIKQCKLGLGLVLETDVSSSKDELECYNSASLGQQALMLSGIAEETELCFFTQQLEKFPKELIETVEKTSKSYVSYLINIKNNALEDEVARSIDIVRRFIDEGDGANSSKGSVSYN